MRFAPLITCVCFALAGCDSIGPYRTDVVHDDHSEIADPRARWEAYGLENYTIEQTRTCFCAPPYRFTVVVKDGDVVDVLFEPPDETYGQTPEELRQGMVRFTRTVDEVFDLLEQEKQSAARFEVDYHPKYGYPTSVFIDPDASMADEEIILTMSNLERLLD